MKKLTRDEMFRGATDFERMLGQKWPEQLSQADIQAYVVVVTPYVSTIFDKYGKYLDTHLDMRLHTWS